MAQQAGLVCLVVVVVLAVAQHLSAMRTSKHHTPRRPTGGLTYEQLMKEFDKQEEPSCGLHVDGCGVGNATDPKIACPGQFPYHTSFYLAPEKMSTDLSKYEHFCDGVQYNDGFYVTMTSCVFKCGVQGGLDIPLQQVKLIISFKNITEKEGTFIYREGFFYGGCSGESGGLLAILAEEDPAFKNTTFQIWSRRTHPCSVARNHRVGDEFILTGYGLKRDPKHREDSREHPLMSVTVRYAECDEQNAQGNKLCVTPKRLRGLHVKKGAPLVRYGKSGYELVGLVEEVSCKKRRCKESYPLSYISIEKYVHYLYDVQTLE